MRMTIDFVIVALEEELETVLSNQDSIKHYGEI